MSLSSREQFEAWADDAVGISTTPSVIEGCYAEVETQTAWDAWQASRAAVVVELPEDIAAGANIVSGCYHHDYMRRVRAAIEAAGLKVAP